MTRAKDTYLQHQQKTVTNDPQEPYIYPEHYERFATSHVAICFLIQTGIERVKKLVGQAKTDAYSDYKAAISMMQMPQAWKDEKMQNLEEANQTDSDRFVQDYWNIPVPDGSVVLVEPLNGQPRVEAGPDGKAVIRTVNQILGGAGL